MLLIIFFRLLIIFTTIGLVFRKSDLRPLKTHKNCGGSKKKSIFLLQICRLYVYPYVRRHKLMSKDILTTVFTSLRKNFLKQAQRILASEEDAEDVVQDAFCKLWRSDYTLKTTNEAEALARTTIRNLSLDELRKQEVRPQFSLDTERDTVLQRSALEEIEIREHFEQVETIIEAELSPSERRVMHLKEYEGHSFEEIAEMMNLTEAAVRMKLSRARKRIRTVYQEQNKKEGGSYDYQ